MEYKDYSFNYNKVIENRSIDVANKLHAQRIEDSLDFFLKYNHGFVYRNCPVCDYSEYIEVGKFHDAYGVCKCGKCNSLYINPIPTEDMLHEYYNNYKCNILYDELVRDRNKKEKNFIVDDRVSTIMNYVEMFDNDKEFNILEIGCGSGGFLSTLYSSINKSQNKSVNLFGIDIDNNAIKKNKNNKEITLINSSVEKYVDDNNLAFDIIVHFELVEHLMYPSHFMKSLKKLLTRNGIMIFTTPNINGFATTAVDYNAKNLIAHSVFPPLHLNAFSTMNITTFAIISGYNIIDISTPGKLDVDIVSILKEECMCREFQYVNKFSDNDKGFIQYLLTSLNSSSHMQCILRRCND